VHKPAMKRWKFTVAPPQVCEGCYWHGRARSTAEHNRKLRLELLKKRTAVPAPRKTAKSSASPEDEEAFAPEDPDVLDVVEQIKRSRGED
jgi:hypothetical protein